MGDAQDQFPYENRVPSILDVTAPASVKAVFLQIVDVFAGFSVVCVLILKPLQEHPTFAYKDQQPNNIFAYPIFAMVKVLVVSRNIEKNILTPGKPERLSLQTNRVISYARIALRVSVTPRPRASGSILGPRSAREWSEAMASNRVLYLVVSLSLLGC